MPVPGVLAVVATATTAVMATVAAHWAQAFAAGAALVLLLVWIVLYTQVSAPINRQLTAAADAGQALPNGRALQAKWDRIIGARQRLTLELIQLTQFEMKPLRSTLPAVHDHPRLLAGEQVDVVRGVDGHADAIAVGEPGGELLPALRHPVPQLLGLRCFRQTRRPQWGNGEAPAPPLPVWLSTELAADR